MILIRYQQALVILIVGLLLVSSVSIISSASNSGAVVLGPKYSYESTSYGTYISFAQTLYADSVSYFSNLVNFTNASLGSPSNPSLTFGTVVENGNASITMIASSQIELEVNSTSIPYVYLNSTEAQGYPNSVTIYYPSIPQTITILPYQYDTNYSFFRAQTSDAVFWSGQNLVVTPGDPTTSFITFSFSTSTSTSNGNGNSGGNGGGPTTTVKGGETLTTTPVVSTSSMARLNLTASQFELLIVLLIIVISIAVFYTRRS